MGTHKTENKEGWGMREVKFCGKSTKTGGWIHGYYVAGKGIKDERHSIIVQDGMVVFVDPATIGQFIGLQDKYNKGGYIYSGDIVRITAACGETYVGEVVWDDRNAQYAVDVGDELWDFANIVNCNHFIEIIGNVHEHPELLERGQNE
jgi:hypothetical protein